MSSPANPIGVQPGAWSAQIARRYHLSLSPELVRWWDDAVWCERGTGEYREPLAPSVLLEAAPEAIWPGLMPPDFLPLISNCAGDWLCLRVGSGGRVVEVVQWYHGGGDWLPWGTTLAEAIVFDAVNALLPGTARRHAVPAEPVRLRERSTADPLLAWALQNLPAQLDPAAMSLLRSPVVNGDAQPIVNEMLRRGWAEVALRSELAQRTLADPRLERLDDEREVLNRLGVDRNTLNEWLFDLERIPAEQRQAILERLDWDSDVEPQDWTRAAEHGRRVTELAPHLAWGWDLSGYAYARSGQFTDAARCFAQGLWRSVFTDQSIRLRTHWATQRGAKFSAVMLRELLDRGEFDLVAAGEPFDVEYWNLLLDPSPGRRERVTGYWLDRGARSLAMGDGEAAYDATLAAGWDLGAESLAAYGAVLDRLVVVAETAADPARAELARTHRRCLSDRLGI